MIFFLLPMLFGMMVTNDGTGDSMNICIKLKSTDSAVKIFRMIHEIISCGEGYFALMNKTSWKCTETNISYFELSLYNCEWCLLYPIKKYPFLLPNIWKSQHNRWSYRYRIPHFLPFICPAFSLFHRGFYLLSRAKQICRIVRCTNSSRQKMLSIQPVRYALSPGEKVELKLTREVASIYCSMRCNNSLSENQRITITSISTDSLKNENIFHTFSGKISYVKMNGTEFIPKQATKSTNEMQTIGTQSKAWLSIKQWRYAANVKRPRVAAIDENM